MTTITVSCPLSRDEMSDILTTIMAMQQEILKPGGAKARGHDLYDDIEDACYRLSDAIERDDATNRRTT